MFKAGEKLLCIKRDSRYLHIAVGSVYTFEHYRQSRLAGREDSYVRLKEFPYTSFDLECFVGACSLARVLFCKEGSDV